ncbi:hypothetical protein GCM10009843_06350 [Nocardioides bigeumensis]|jgi:hypothetical protein|uniref:Major facilitator superfamily (MFS) profile domain-containing protein n=1 Tax=Nocardioides bigeumensis TaxID=433657 RepID=A0ABN2XSJ6_9ACTN
MLCSVERETSWLAVVGGVLGGVVAFGIWTMLMVALAYGVTAAMGDTGGTVVLLTLLVVSLGAALLLLVLPGTRHAASGLVGGLAGGFLVTAAGTVLLALAAGWSL